LRFTKMPKTMMAAWLMLRALTMLHAQMAVEAHPAPSVVESGEAAPASLWLRGSSPTHVAMALDSRDARAPPPSS
jgi:hypothetical protein